jgi:hypothetical protein
MAMRLNDILTRLYHYQLPCTVFALVLLLAAGGPSAHAVDNNILTVTATVLSKNVCKFNSATATLNFGTLDPGNPVDVTQSTIVTLRCNGSAPIAAFNITNDDGLYETGPSANRMRHATVLTEYLPYTLSLNPVSGTVPKNTNRNLTITGTVTGVNYQSAQAGNYADTVILSLNP